MDAAREALVKLLGRDHLLLDPELRAGFEHDATGRFVGTAAAVARPADPEQVAALLAVCFQHGIPVVPQGGNTGLVGGGVPRNGELVLSLTRLQELGEIDRAANQVVVGAGISLAQLQRHARAAGLDVGIDHGARDAATIGGMVATNAGGGLAMRYGTMRAQVAGVEAVLADGTVIDRISGLLKDNAGYDLTALLVGSEGTLAVITRVAVRLIPAHAHRVVALFGLPDLDRALHLTAGLRDRVASLVAADFFDAAGLRRVCGHSGRRMPFARAWPIYLVVECRSDSDPTEDLAAAVDWLEADVAVAVADDSTGRERIWSYRELQNESIAAAGVPHKLDVSVPISEVPRFAADARARVAAIEASAETILYGHLGDGNVHVNVLGPPPDDERVDEAVLELVSELGGSVSAEHGVGVAKRDHLHLCRSAGEIAAMSHLKAALDPTGILNPGCVLPAAASARG
jgi:FAD/FMN-containing dehydrogenase